MFLEKQNKPQVLKERKIYEDLESLGQRVKRAEKKNTRMELSFFTFFFVLEIEKKGKRKKKGKKKTGDFNLLRNRKTKKK